MKNYVKCLGIIALVAVIGLLAACGGEVPEKTIKVTGVTAEYLKETKFEIQVRADAFTPGEHTVAKGDGRLSASTVTFDLYIEGSNSTRWTDKGTFNLWLFINGNWVAYADIIEIKDAVTTIPFSKFTFW